MAAEAAHATRLAQLEARLAEAEAETVLARCSARDARQTAIDDMSAQAAAEKEATDW